MRRYQVNAGFLLQHHHGYLATFTILHHTGHERADWLRNRIVKESPLVTLSHRDMQVLNQSQTGHQKRLQASVLTTSFAHVSRRAPSSWRTFCIEHQILDVISKLHRLVVLHPQWHLSSRKWTWFGWPMAARYWRRTHTQNGVEKEARQPLCGSRVTLGCRFAVAHNQSDSTGSDVFYSSQCFALSRRPCPRSTWVWAQGHGVRARHATQWTTSRHRCSSDIRKFSLHSSSVHSFPPSRLCFVWSSTVHDKNQMEIVTRHKCFNVCVPPSPVGDDTSTYHWS